MEPKVLYEDDQILVLDKPAGMTVNRSETTVGEKTVQEWVENKFKVQSSKFKADEESDFYKRAGIVHRLDKETSGILLVAKNQESFENLQKQFKERRVKKVYNALVHGKVVPSDGEIRVPIGRLPWNRKRFGVIAGGRDAVTRYKVIKYYSCHPELDSGSRSRNKFGMTKKRVRDDNKRTLLEIFPETGRTHQIRVHLKYFGHPIFSDSLYTGRKTARDDRKILSRMFLHASKISFNHPKTGKSMSFESPLPHDLKQFFEAKP